MRVLINMAPLGAEAHGIQAATGVHRVVEELSRGLRDRARQAPPGELEVCYHSTEGLWAAKGYYERHLRGPGMCFAARPWQLAAGRHLFGLDAFVRRTLGRNALPLRAARRAAVDYAAAWGVPLGRVPAREADLLDIYHSPSRPVPAWVKRHRRLRSRRFTMVHDVIALTHPEFFPPVTVAFTRRLVRGLSPEDWVICNSRATRDALLTFTQGNCDPAKTFVALLAAGEHFQPETRPERLAAVRARYGIPPDAPYFLSVCTRERRKNLDTVIRGFARFCRETKRRDVRLVLAGGPGWLTERMTAALDAAGELRRQVLQTGFVDDADLPALYSGARAFLYLSLHEGFGLPPLEAMACGTPAVVSNTSSLPEVVGDAGVLLAPDDLDGLCQHLGALLDDTGGARETLAARSLARAQRFSWRNFVAQNLAAYRVAMTGGRSAGA